MIAATSLLARIGPKILRRASRYPRRTFSSTRRSLADEVRIVEVGPRDGLQNEKSRVPLATKLELIRRLARTGIRDMEAGSFVRPNLVPQMADSDQILNHLLGHPVPAPHAIRYNFLVPNLRGFENFLRADEAATPPPKTAGTPDPLTSSQNPNAYPVTPPASPGDPGPSPNGGEPEETGPITSTQDPNEMPSRDPPATTATSSPPFSTEVSIFAAATEAFSKANTNCTIAESMERFRPIVSLAKEHDIRVRGYVSVALGCPYEGRDVSPIRVAEITRTLLEMGVDEVSVADTTGMGTAPRTRDLLKALSAAGIANQDLALHFHDTYGQALVNTAVGLEHGIRTFDSSVGGLGGCPFSKGATGNVASEDLVYCLHSLGLKTGVDLEEMAQIGSWISKELGLQVDSRAGKAILARLSER